MLYNVLPPLVFFGSLGGIILIVSRVVARLRRQQFETDIKRRAAAVKNTASDKAQSLERVVGPARRGVQSFGSPIALVKHLTSTTVQRTKTELAHRRDQRAQRRQAKQAAQVEQAALESVRSATTTEPADATTSTETIQQPSAPLRERFSRFGTGLQTLTSKIKRPTRSQPLPEQLPSTPDTTPPAAAPTTPATTPEPKPAKAFSIKRRTLPSADQPAEPAAQEEEEKDATPEPAAAPTEATEASEASEPSPEAAPTESDTPAPAARAIASGKLNMNKLFANKKKPLTAAEQAIHDAEAALTATDFSRVEEILIPHIYKHPRDAKAYMLLGEAALAGEAWEDAIAAFEQVVEIDPGTKGCQAGLGRAAFRSGNFTRAIELLQQAHAAEPENTEILRDLITIAKRLDNQPMHQSLSAELAELEEKPAA